MRTRRSGKQRPLLDSDGHDRRVGKITDVRLNSSKNISACDLNQSLNVSFYGLKLRKRRDGQINYD